MIFEIIFMFRNHFTDRKVINVMLDKLLV